MSNLRAQEIDNSGSFAGVVSCERRISETQEVGDIEINHYGEDAAPNSATHAI